MKEFEFFRNLKNEEKNYLLKNSKYVELNKDTTLFYQDDICENILFLKDGVVQLLMYGELGESIHLYDISKGEQCIINISSTISQTKTVASAVAKTNIKGWLVPANIIKELMIKSPTYQQYIFSLFSLKFSTLTTLIEDIKFKRLDSRILNYLKNKKTKIIETTHEDIANELSTSRVVVSRVLKELEKKSLIKLHRGKIEIF